MPTRRAVPGARPEALFQPPPERQPLAARMRPRTLEEFVGQAHLVGERGPLRRSVARGHLVDLLLWGPPGTGKTSLARLLADAVGAEFRTVSAVMSGVAEVRAAIAEAQDRLALEGRRTVLFIDEIHRFNKAQQDALLPHVEDGTSRSIGATTENPYFEVNAALLSRLRVWRLEPLTDEDVAHDRAARARGRGARPGRLVRPAGRRRAGRRRLRAPRRARGRRRAPGAQRARGRRSRWPRTRTPATPTGRVSPTLADVEAAAQQRVLAYDRAGDGHYDTVSAFIKSLRGNDPDAALYWLAAMVAAGEDPRFIARRLIISASEDVGNADPRALQVAVAAAQALDYIGLPEAQYALAQATAYIATAPKSNRAGARLLGGGRPTSSSGARCPSRYHLRNAARPADEAPRHRRRVPLPARLRRATTWSSSTCPTSSPTAATTCPTDQGYERDDRRADGRREARARGGRGPPARTRRNPVPGRRSTG